MKAIHYWNTYNVTTPERMNNSAIFNILDQKEEVYIYRGYKCNVQNEHAFAIKLISIIVMLIDIQILTVTVVEVRVYF